MRFQIFDTVPVSTSTTYPAKDEGGGVVSILSENNGERPYRQLQLVDCRAGVDLFVSDNEVSEMSGAFEVPTDTTFQRLIGRLRREGRLSDLQYSGNQIANVAGAAAAREDGRKVVVELANPSDSEGLSCACNLYYPGSVRNWVPLHVRRNLYPKTLAEARAMVDAWRAERDLELSARVNE